jgi:hypothetical protein
MTYLIISVKRRFENCFRIEVIYYKYLQMPPQLSAYTYIHNETVCT